MAVQELIPTLRELSRSQKLEVIQFLAKELAIEEEMPLKQGATYEVWSPFDSHEAALKLATLLEDDRALLTQRGANDSAQPLTLDLVG